MSQTIACVPCETKQSSKASLKEGHLRGMSWHNTGETGRMALQSGNARGKDLHREDLAPAKDTESVSEASGGKKGEDERRGEQMRG